jgi:integron integrase
MSTDIKDKQKHFWNKYLTYLSDADIKPGLFTWYVRHCETFIRTQRDTRLRQHTSDSVNRYLSSLINSGNKPAWQKQQAIHAIQILFQSIHAPLYGQIDWLHWRSSCRDMSADHDTNYRNNHPVKPVIPDRAPELNTEQLTLIASAEKQLRIAFRRNNNSIRTEKTYLHWIMQFLRYTGFHGFEEVNQESVIRFLEHLAINRNVAPKTQSIALNAISYFFKNILQHEIGDISRFVRARAREKLPVILTRDEVRQVLRELTGTQQLVVALLYGAGLRIMEAVRLRVQDIDFGYQQIIVRESKGNKERAIPLPTRLTQRLRQHLAEIKKIHEQDINNGHGEVFMPQGLLKKYGKSGKQWVWQYVFPSQKLSVDPRSSMIRRHHVDESTIQKTIRATSRKLEIPKRVSCHTFRHSYATHLLEQGTDIRRIQALLGHADVSTTMVYTHLANFANGKTSSPLDDL